MAIAPQVSLLLEELAALHPPITTLSIAQARALREKVYPQLWGALAPVERVTERQIPGPFGQIPLRIYQPIPQLPLPILVYLHGGGWVTCSVDAYDGLCRALAKAAGCVVVSVNYRLAPEFKFPVAVEEAYAATRWVVEHAFELGGDASCVGIGGDSCGGNLTAAVALIARERRTPPLLFQMLLYPCTDYEFDSPSALENANGYYLTLDGMRWFWQQYLKSETDAAHPYASPLRAQDLSHLPPALIVTAEFDPLRDQGRAYASRLQAAGVPVTYKCYEGMIHCFLSFPSRLERATEGLQELATWLRQAFNQH